MEILNSDVGYYDPSQSTKPVSFVTKQLYPMHIKDVSIKEVGVKGKYKAKVYNFTCEVASECSNNTYETMDVKTKEPITIPGSSYVGKEIKSKGFFMFLNPKPGDDFQANNGANESYLSLCESLGIEMNDVEIEVDGEKRVVKEFPVLSKDNLVGKPALGYVDKESWTDMDGNKRVSYKVKGFNLWYEGVMKDYYSDDVPF